jgi:hypothetical protein
MPIYKDYSSLNRWQAYMDLLSAIYFSITTHQRKDKNASVLPLGDVNLKTVLPLGDVNLKTRFT